MEASEKWIQTAEALPDSGQAVHFLIEHHAVWMTGIYRDGFFESHWASHDAGRVQCWCPHEPDDESRKAAPAVP